MKDNSYLKLKGKPVVFREMFGYDTLKYSYLGSYSTSNLILVWEAPSSFLALIVYIPASRLVTLVMFNTPLIENIRS